MTRTMKTILLMGLGAIGLLSARAFGDLAPVPEPVYPRVDISPMAPWPTDSVMLTLVKGMASSPCEAPTYTDVSHTTRLVQGGQAPVYEIDLAYTEVPVPPGTICPDIYQPTEYGPEYQLGLLPEGTYLARDGNTVLDTFVVSASTPRVSVDGTVYENVGALDVIRWIPGTKVYLQVPTSTGPFLDLGGSISVLYEVPYRTIDSAIADRSGYYAFPDQIPGSYRLTYSHPSYQYAQVNLYTSKDTTVNVWLLPIGAMGSISGVVTEKCPDGWVCLWNPPVADAVVQVRLLMYVCAYDVLDKAQALDTGLVAVTDSLGRFFIDSIPIYEPQPCQGYSYSVLVSKAGYANAYQSFEPQLGLTTTVNVEIERLLGVDMAGGRGPGVEERVRVSGSSLVMSLSSEQLVSVELMRLDGKRIDTGSFSRFLSAGTHRLELPSAMAAGVYLARVSANGVSQVCRIQTGR
jgi:hypothetical protein